MTLLLHTLEIFLALFIFSTTILHLDTPLDWDESNIGSKLANKEYLQAGDSTDELNRGEITLNVLNPFGAVRNHTIAHLLSLASITYFRPLDLALRYPAVLITFFLLLLICFFCRSQFDLITRVFLLLHLSVNQLALWYFHSSRGYGAMMLGTAFVFCMALKIISGERRKHGDLFLFALGMLFTIFTHTFGAIFCVLICGASLGSLLLKKKTGEAFQKYPEWRIFVVSLLFLPLILFIGYRHLTFIKRIGFVNASKPATIPDSIYAVFGNLNSAWGIPFLLFLCYLIWAHRLWKKGTWNHFFSLVPLFSILSTLVFLFVLKLSFFEPRFLLGYLIPVVLWLVETSRRIPSPIHRRISYLGLFTFLILTPLLGRENVYEHITHHTREYFYFARSVQSITGSIPDKCFSFSGEHDQSYISESLYFRNEEGSNRKCKNHFHLHFYYSWKGRAELPQHEDSIYEKIFEENERALFRVLPKVTELVSADL